MHHYVLIWKLGMFICVVFFLKMNVMILLSKKINQFSSVLNPDVIEVLVVKADEFSLKVSS